MGKTRTALIGETQTATGPEGLKARREKKKKEHKRSLKKERGLASPKAMPTARVRVPGLKGGERVVAITTELPLEEEKQEPKAKKIRVHKRGKKYLANLAKIDPTKYYNIPEAIELVRQTSFSRFDGKLELHAVLAKKGSASWRIETVLPHPELSTTKRVEIASEETLKKLEKGVIDFDVLLSTLDFMPRLVPFAKLLGPRGLMPNPKNGTIVENPAAALERFSTKLVLQTERDAPLLHLVVGKLSSPTDQLAENLESIVQVIGRQNIKKLVVKATMGPGVKLAVG